jgi:tetratricopeptide (TPR) repeat protein
MARDRTWRLLERDGEVAELSGMLDHAAAGAGAVALVEGQAGIGKTRLLQEGRRLAADAGLAVLSARGAELERDFPFGVVRQLLEPALNALNEDERERALGGAAAGARPVLFGTPAADGGNVFTALHGLYWVVANLAERAPLLVSIDDAHWADASSVRFAAYLARRIEGLPALLLCAFRPAEPGAEPGVLDELRAEPAARTIRPAPLSTEAVARIAGAELSGADPEFSRACHEASGGNPLLLHELLGALARERVEPSAGAVSRVRELGPDAVARSVLRRLERLPEGAVALAEAVAVLGDDAEMPVAARLAELEEAAAADLAERLAAAEILHPGSPLGFVHPVVRAAVYESLGRAERAERHARAAELVSEAGADPDRVAAHLIATPPGADAELIEALRSAGDRAVRRGAVDAGVAYLRRALAEDQPAESRVELLFQLGAAEAVIDGVAAAEHLRHALELSTEPQRRSEITQLLAETLVTIGRDAEAVALLKQMIPEVESADAQQALFLECKLLIIERHVCFGVAFSEERVDRLEAGLVPDSGPSREALCAVLRERVLQNEIGARGAAELAEQTLAGGRLIDEMKTDNVMVFIPIHTLVAADEFERSDYYLNLALHDARRRGSAVGFAAYGNFRARWAYHFGRVADAASYARPGLDAALAHGFWWLVPTILAFLVTPLVEAGDLEEAHEAIERTPCPPEMEGSIMYNPLREARGLLRVAQGDREGGLRELFECGRADRAWGDNCPAILWWRSSTADVPPASATRPDGWPRRSWSSRAGGERGGRSACRCARWGRRRAESGESSACARPSACSSARRPAWSTLARWSTSGRACAAPGSGRTPARACAVGATWLAGAERYRWPGGRTTSSWRRARGRGASS